MTAAPSNIESLLRHQNWVRALARSLVADPSRAEDVAQQTMLEAITKAPSDLRQPKGWLAQVARNVARGFSRTDRRRIAREQEVATSDTEHADPADAMHRASAHKSLVDAVFALDEPYHTVVVLRYFEDLEPQQIATQVGRPVSTVRTQLQRGLQQMRDKLDQGFGDRRAWHAAILPLFAREQVAAGVPILSGVGLTAIGSLAMWKILTPVVALIAALFVGFQTIWAEAPAAPSNGSNAPLSVAVASQGVDETPVEATTRTKPNVVIAKPTMAAPPAAGFRARVVSLDGTPLVGMEMTYHDHRLPRLVGNMLVHNQTSVRIDQEGLRDMLSTRAGIESFAASYGRYADVVTALLSGEQVDRPTAVTNGLGEFTFEREEVQDHLRTERAGWMIYGKGTLFGGDGLVYVVGPAVDVSGHIVDSHGKPIDRAYVSVGFTLHNLPGYGQQLGEGPYRSWNANTGADGSFQLGLIPKHSAIHVNASKSRYVGHEVTATDIHGPVRWELKRKPNQEMIAGQVLLSDGQPAVAATVLFGGARGKCDAQGKFEMARRYTSGNPPLLAYRRGLQPAIRPDFAKDLKSDPSAARDIVLRLGPETLEISGRVVNANDQPIQGVKVLLVDGVQDGNASQWIESVLGNQSNKGEVTGRDGSFTFRGLAARNYTIRAIDDRAVAIVESNPTRAGTTGLQLRFTSDAVRHLDGQVIDRHGQPIAGVNVKLLTAQTKTAKSTQWHRLGTQIKTDASGRFSFDRCPSQHALLGIDGPDVPWTRVKIPQGSEPMQLTVPRLIRFKLRLTSNLTADSFAIESQTGERIDFESFSADMQFGSNMHEIASENAPYYKVEDRGAVLVLLRDKNEVGRVPLNLLVGELNVIDI